MNRYETESLRTVLARNVRQLRHERGLSQEELADRAGLHRTYIGSIERGERNLTVDNIQKIARGLDVDAAHLLAGSTEHGDGGEASRHSASMADDTTASDGNGPPRRPRR